MHPTFPLLDGVLSLFQLLVWNLGRRLWNTEEYIYQHGGTQLLHWLKCATTGTVFLPRRPLQGRTTHECTGDWGLPLRRCGTRDQWPAFWTAGPVLDPLLWQQRKVGVKKLTMASSHFSGLYENRLPSLTGLCNISGNVKACSQVSVMWSLTLNVTDKGRETFDLHGHSVNCLHEGFNF